MNMFGYTIVTLTTALGSSGQEGEQHVRQSLDTIRLIGSLSLSKATRHQEPACLGGNYGRGPLLLILDK